MRRNTRDILEVVVNNNEKNIDINIEKNEQLQLMSLFTVKEIEMH